MTLHELAGLVSYWRQYPPTHVTLGALARSLTGNTRTTAAPTRRAPDGDKPATTNGMEGLAAVLGPPTHKFRPPCRMQTPAPPADNPE